MAKKKNKKYKQIYTTGGRVDMSNGGRVSLRHGGPHDLQKMKMTVGLILIQMYLESLQRFKVFVMQSGLLQLRMLRKQLTKLQACNI